MSRTPELMLASRAAEFLGISRQLLTKWNRAGVGPPRTRKLKRYWYSREALREWLRDGAVEAADERASPQLGKQPRLPNAGNGRVHQ